MRQIFYICSLLTLLVLVYVVDYFVGQIYARYVIVFTGAILLLGILVGQRSERNWLNRKRTSKKPPVQGAFLGSDGSLGRK